MMPIDPNYRHTWTIFEDHDGHPVWRTDCVGNGRIHGLVVGVHVESCIACQKCVEACPVHVFTVWSPDSHTDVADPLRERDCIQCLLCEITCPVQAISVLRVHGSDETLESLLHDAQDES